LHKPRAVENWLKTFDDYLELNPSQCATERMVVLNAASNLEEPAKGDYNAYMAKNGEFTAWLKMKAWLLELIARLIPSTLTVMPSSSVLDNGSEKAPTTSTVDSSTPPISSILQLQRHISHTGFHYGYFRITKSKSDPKQNFPNGINHSIASSLRLNGGLHLSLSQAWDRPQTGDVKISAQRLLRWIHTPINGPELRIPVRKLPPRVQEMTLPHGWATKVP